MKHTTILYREGEIGRYIVECTFVIAPISVPSIQSNAHSLVCPLQATTFTLYYINNSLAVAVPKCINILPNLNALLPYSKRKMLR